MLLKMQGITPMMDQTELPALMQRYGNDPAKAWAAFEAGPDTIDRLIAQRGDDWYAGVGDDTRRFVGSNMPMLDAPKSSHDRSVNSPAIAAGIATQTREHPDISARRPDLAQRTVSGIPDGLGLPVPASTQQSYSSLQPAAYWQPNPGLGIQGRDASEIENDPSIGATTPVAAQRQARAGENTTPAKPVEKLQRVVPQVTIDRNRAQAETDLRNPYFRALMTLIGRYEGSDNPNFGNGYYTINGHLKKGDDLKDLSVFPANVGNRAVGRYQIQRDGLLSYAAPPLGITSFTPHDQDLMAAYVIRRRGMYDALVAGNFPDAAVRISRIWASFPTQAKAGGAYNQAHLNYDTFLKDFKAELGRTQRTEEPDANPFLRKIPMGRFGFYDPSRL